MLYQTKAIASPQITWLQKADESQRHQQDADAFINQPAFDEFWLRHVNAEHFPVFNHQVSAVGYDEGIERTIFINANFYLVIGGSKGIFNSISIYNTIRSVPDVELVGLGEPGKIADCIVQHIDSETIAVIYNIDQMYISESSPWALRTKTQVHIPLMITMVTLFRFAHSQQQQLEYLGKRMTDKIYEIDVLSDLSQKTLHCQTISSGTNKEFNLAISHLDAVFALYKEQLIKVHVDQNSEIREFCM